MEDLMIPWLCFVGVIAISIVIAIITTIKSEVEG